ncbi:Unknown protein, partial [Striga hermonthica]
FKKALRSTFSQPDPSHLPRPESPQVLRSAAGSPSHVAATPFIPSDTVAPDGQDLDNQHWVQFGSLPVRPLSPPSEFAALDTRSSTPLLPSAQTRNSHLPFLPLTHILPSAQKDHNIGPNHTQGPILELCPTQSPNEPYGSPSMAHFQSSPNSPTHSSVPLNSPSSTTPHYKPNSDHTVPSFLHQKDRRASIYFSSVNTSDTLPPAGDLPSSSGTSVSISQVGGPHIPPASSLAGPVPEIPAVNSTETFRSGQTTAANALIGLGHLTSSFTGYGVPSLSMGGILGRGPTSAIISPPEETTFVNFMDFSERLTRNSVGQGPHTAIPPPQAVNQSSRPSEARSFRDAVTGSSTAKPGHQKLSLESFQDTQSGTVTRSEEGRFK